MRISVITKFGVAALLVLTFTVGCSKQSSAPPPPLAIEEVPAALSKAFTKAKPESKELVDQIVSALQTNGYSAAYSGLQNLAAKSGLSKEQQGVTTRGMLAVYNILQTAQTKGDEQAADTLKTYRVFK